jgi:FtsP/CotA-like multicopper oxidase with cupredoxin domain
VAEEQTTTVRTGQFVVAGVAIAAVFLSLLALGKAFSNDSSGGVSVAGVEDPGAGAADAATIELADFTVDPDTAALAADAVLTVENVGSSPHNLKVKGQEEAYSTADLQGGETGTLELTGLAPDTYTFYCDIPGHEAAGMVATYTVGQVADGGATDGEAAAEPAVDGETLTGMERAQWLRANYEASVGQFPAETGALGNQPMEPEILDDGTKLFELTIDEIEWEVAPGEFVEATAYNGQVPGPRIAVDVGDRVTIRVVNELDDEATTLHPHGIFQHPFEVDGVGMVSMEPIMPGGAWEGTFTTKEPSVGMYHGHDNGVHQVINGAFGVFLVGDMPLPPEADNVVAEHEMVLNDAGNIGLTLNGKSFPATEPYVLKDGEQMILHYYNEGLTPHPMHLHNNAQLVIAKDGYPLAQPYRADTVNVAPGERYTVVVFAESPGTWVWHCHILTHVERDDGSVFGMFTALVVEPDEEAGDDTARDAGRDTTPSPLDTPA